MRLKLRAWDGQKVCEVKNIEFTKDGVVVTKDDDYFGYAGSDIKLMQSTGLYDKKGQEIYTGDIIKYCSGEFDDQGHWHKYEYIEPVELEGGCFYPVCVGFPEDFEVIGNIYDNPELLK